ncbi:DUF2971 domain-containing protein [Leptospira meyeri]|uniref:DUF2971 domain-containing protein n=1 Tax=Leptospira meyeri TaxID=29508 RepID=UPI0002BDE606|nr:DUF2971 domain-containing protein [Leptospira meyeri]EMJ86224.1 PF11185 family protein [Leptospira meyeri serovar Semaranga str. Veldrot Semarang 173]
MIIKKTIGIINEDLVIWRYISLEKLVDILESNSLYFSSLESLWKIDPFEGYFPEPHLEAFRKLINIQFNELEENYSKIAGVSKNSVDSFKEEFKENVSKKFKDLISSIVVNCWHINDHESEGMWKIYAESNKGIAIQTNFGSLYESINQDQKIEHVTFGKVKYIDFLDKNLSQKDYLVEGTTSTPLLKRTSYEHEKELRAFIIPSPKIREFYANDKKSIRVSINPNILIKNIYISPFAKESYISCIKTICKKYNIQDNKIVASKLLTTNERIHKLF